MRSKPIAQRLDRDVDHLVWELRPTALDDLGLRAALANYVQDWSQRVGISAELHTSGLLDDRLPVRRRNGALPHRAGSAHQRRQARAGRRTSRSSSSGAPTTSCSSSRTTAWDSIRPARARRRPGVRPARHAGARGAGRRDARDRIGRRQGHDRPRAHGDAARAGDDGRSCLNAAPASHPARRRSRHRAPRAQAADRQPARHEGRRRSQRRRRGVQSALALKPDVIVMDISMPGMNGLAATRALKQLQPDVGDRHADAAWRRCLPAGAAARGRVGLRAEAERAHRAAAGDSRRGGRRAVPGLRR